MTTFAKTDAGQREIREKTRELSRPARTVLLLSDGSRGREELLAMVQGATAADVAALLEAGLIVETGAAASTRSSSSSAAAPAAAPAEAEIAESPLGYRELYDSLTLLAKEQLGLFKGYRFALEIEKAADLAELQQVAVRFASEVQKANGDAAAQTVRRALGLVR